MDMRLARGWHDNVAISEGGEASQADDHFVIIIFLCWLIRSLCLTLCHTTTTGPTASQYQT